MARAIPLSVLEHVQDMKMGERLVLATGQTAAIQLMATRKWSRTWTVMTRVNMLNIYAIGMVTRVPNMLTMVG